MDYQISEVFTSIQFEGLHSGTLARFVRFAGCNLDCKWCDTPQKNVAELISLGELRKRINEDPIPQHIVLTGGEPTLQPIHKLIDFGEFEDERFIALETNGTQIVELIRCADQGLGITFSPKNFAGWKDVYSQIETNDIAEVKIIEGTLTPYEFEWIIGRGWKRVYIQPQWGVKESFQRSIDLMNEYPYMRMSYQTHKLVGLR